MHRINDYGDHHVSDLVVPSAQALTFLFTCKGHKLRNEGDIEEVQGLGTTIEICKTHWWVCSECGAKFKIIEYFDPDTSEHSRDSFVGYLHESTPKMELYRPWTGNFSCNEYIIKSIIE